MIGETSSTGMLKKPAIWDACKSLDTTRSAPAVSNISATSFALIGCLGLALRSCLAYPKYGITQVIVFALALLQASIQINNSINLSVTGEHVD